MYELFTGQKTLNLRVGIDGCCGDCNSGYNNTDDCNGESTHRDPLRWHVNQLLMANTHRKTRVSRRRQLRRRCMCMFASVPLLSSAAVAASTHRRQTGRLAAGRSESIDRRPHLRHGFIAFANTVIMSVRRDC